MTAISTAATQHAVPTSEPLRGDVRCWVLDLQLLVIGLGPLLSAIATPRYFGLDYTQSLAAAADSSALGRLAYLASGRAVLLVGLLGLLAMLPGLRLSSTGRWLTVGFCSLAAASAVAAQLGTVKSSVVPPLAILLIGVSWYFGPAVGWQWLARRLVVLFRLYAVGSLIAAVVAPSWALESNYADSFMPGIGFRLHGLAPHANLLAPIILLGLLVERYRPPHNATRSSWMWTAASAVALLLTQSKTTLVAAGVIISVEWVRLSRQRERGRRLAADATMAVVVVFLASFVWRGTAITDTSGPITSVPTLRAREDVWGVTLKLWHDNPVFGYGLKLWDTDMRLAYLHQLGWAPPHAHNQLVQTLGEAGLVGAAALLVYVVALIGAGLSTASTSRGLSLAVVVLVLVRGLTECPLARAGGDLLLPAAVFVILLTLMRPPEQTCST